MLVGSTKFVARWLRKVIGGFTVAAGLLIMVTSVSGCDFLFPTSVESERALETPQPAVSVPPPPTATPAPATPTALPAPTSMPTPTPQPVSQHEAQTVVQAWFDSLADQDYAAMEELTAEDATLHTRELTEAIQDEASRERVNIDIVTRRLEMQPGERLQRGEAVDTDFRVDINVLVGPFSFAGRQMPGTATFVVDRVNGAPKIVDIENVIGLPLP